MLGIAGRAAEALRDWSNMLKLISCNVFVREACWAIAQSPQVIDVEFTELGEHVRSEGLANLIQSRIDAAENSGKNYEAILLLFGLCGNGVVGVQARQTPLVMPRAHDCCTILLGSRQRFLEHFGADPSTPFSSAGYLERGSYFLRTADDGTQHVDTGDEMKSLIERFGEEDAKFIYEQMHPQHDANQRAVFIDLPQTRHLGHAERFAKMAAEAGKEFVRMEGDIRLIRDLIHGRWNDGEFLVVPPGKTIEGVYDHEQVVRAR